MDTNINKNGVLIRFKDKYAPVAFDAYAEACRKDGKHEDAEEIQKLADKSRKLVKKEAVPALS